MLWKNYGNARWRKQMQIWIYNMLESVLKISLLSIQENNTAESQKWLYFDGRTMEDFSILFHILMFWKS